MQLDPRQWTLKQRIGVVLAATLVGTVFVVLVVWLSGDDSGKSPTDNAITSAEKATGDGDYDQAFATLKEAESQAKTDEEKVRLYNDLAAAAANAGKLQEALEYYDQKHQLDPNSRSADGFLLGELYERTNDPAKALASYKLFVEYAETLSQEEFGNAQAESIKERIKQLEGQL